jgi:Na+-driven multidrug efflux pump
VPLAYGMCYLTRSDAFPNGRSECVFISLMIAWVLGATITGIFYARGKWKEKAISSME